MNPEAWATAELPSISAEYHAALTADWREMPAEVRATIPEHLRGGLDRYIGERIEPGRFLRAVLENDLQGAVMRANPADVLTTLPDILRALYTYAPGMCYGSREIVAKWLAEPKP